MSKEPKFDHAPFPGRIQFIAYGNGEPLEFTLAARKTAKANIEQAKFEARWQLQPMVKVRDESGVILYDGASK